MNYTDVDRDQYIYSVLNEELRDTLRTPCYNLSVCLGDYSTKITPGMLTPILNNLTISFPGIVVQGSIDEGNYKEPIGDKLLGEPIYSVEVTPKSFEIYNGYKSSDADYVVRSNNQLPNKSRLLASELLSLPPELRTAICGLYVECMSLYRELLYCTLDSGMESIARTDLKRIISNIRWCNYRLERLYSTPYELLETMRGLQRTLSFIHSIPQLFRYTYKGKITTFSQEVESDV